MFIVDSARILWRQPLSAPMNYERCCVETLNVDRTTCEISIYVITAKTSLKMMQEAIGLAQTHKNISYVMLRDAQKR